MARCKSACHLNPLNGNYDERLTAIDCKCATRSYCSSLPFFCKYG